MMSKSEIREWLDTLPEDAEVGVDKGGLCLQARGSEAYLEIGGLPKEELTRKQRGSGRRLFTPEPNSDRLPRPPTGHKL
jgi:hypothetical protein